jgi:putative transposase
MPDQAQWLRQAVGVSRFAFNWALAEWKRRYETGEKSSAYALKKQFNAIRREQFPWTYTVTKCSVDSGFRNLDKAFKNFFRRCKQGVEKKGHPKFKSRKNKHQSFTLDGVRVKPDGYWVKLEKLATLVNMTEELRFVGKITSATISTDGEHWFISFNVEVEKPEGYQHPQESVGIDLGVKTLAVLSNGVQFENQKLLRSELNKVKRLNRELSRRKKDSNRWKATKLKLARLHRKIANRRLDYIHKMTTKIAQTYRIVGMEDLNIAGMLHNHKLALSIADAGFGEINRQMAYKVDWFNGELVKIGRFFPSSKLCSVCGAIKSDLTLSDRLYICECGNKKDRDWNAATNIENEALRIVAGMVISTLKTDVDGSVRPLAAVPCEASTYLGVYN